MTPLPTRSTARLLAAGFLGFVSMALPAHAGSCEAARGVLERLLPEHASRFVLESIPRQGGLDAFEVESRDARVVLRGSSGVAICSALNWYLANACHASTSWCGDQLDLPVPLPAVPAKIRRVSPHRYRYFFNYCAFSYTLAWWDWAQWERIIDWMALHGINMPLSVTGQEAVWREVLPQLGLEESRFQDFFVGPAYLPFGWMGCMDGWGGPLPDRWIDKRRKLQERILERERELGMTPVLQGFTGHVPAALKAVFPSAAFRRLPSWCGFPGTWFVDPMDPLFTRVGKAFVETQTRLYGTDHLYAADTFIEMSPPSSDPEFLTAMGKAVHGAMKAADPQAVWVMQGWLFVNNPGFWKPPQTRALFAGVPDDRMIVIDLACEWRPAWPLTKAFHGKPWIWCIIQNYGHTVSLHGGLPQITRNLQTALTSPKRGRMSGIGVIMEGLGYNPVVYDWVTDMTWRSQVPPLEDWIENYVHRRYGRQTPELREAWKLLLETAYRTPGRTGSVICARPVLRAPRGWSRGPPPYDTARLARAWEALLKAAGDLGSRDAYRFDLVNVARQVLANAAGVLHVRMGMAYEARDRKTLRQAGDAFLRLIGDMDGLLATRREFLLGRWLSDAKRWAVTDEERRLYEWNARNQITLWGPRDSVLHGYARKQWSGLLGGFHRKRWKMFIDALDESLAAGKNLDAQAFERRVREWEEAWTHGTDNYPTEPRGDAVSVARALWQRYRGLVEVTESRR